MAWRIAIWVLLKSTLKSGLCRQAPGQPLQVGSSRVERYFLYKKMRPRAPPRCPNINNVDFFLIINHIRGVKQIGSLA